MDWSNERYVRFYTRDTTTWRLLAWQGQALLPQLLKMVDRAGVLDLGGVGAADAVAAGLPRWPREVVDVGVESLEIRGVIEIRPTAIVLPNFIEAQEAAQSEAQKKRNQREKRRAMSRFGNDSPFSGPEVPIVSPEVPPSLAVPPVLSRAEGTRGSELALDPAPLCPEADPEHTPAGGVLTETPDLASPSPTNTEPNPGATFALTSQRPASRRDGSGKTASQRRTGRARELWERYEAHRVQTLTVRPRRPDARKLEQAAAAIVRLVEHVRSVEGVDEEPAWLRVEAYGKGAIDEAALGDRDPNWARKLIAFRGDWNEWRPSRFDKWAANEGAGTSRAKRRGFIDPADMDHETEIPF